jgi:hypothetical protein
VTFSLVVRDESGAFGMVICSSSPAVASRCVHLRAGVGAVASQNVTNPQLGSIALQALASDLDASEALNTALASERHRAYRQLVVVDRRGNTAIHTGEHALGINHQEETKNAAAAGNMLRHEGVIRSLLYGFTSSAGRCLGGRPPRAGVQRRPPSGRRRALAGHRSQGRLARRPGGRTPASLERVGASETGLSDPWVGSHGGALLRRTG